MVYRFNRLSSMAIMYPFILINLVHIGSQTWIGKHQLGDDEKDELTNDQFGEEPFRPFQDISSSEIGFLFIYAQFRGSFYMI